MTFPNREPSTRAFSSAPSSVRARRHPVPVVSGGGTPALFTAQSIRSSPSTARGLHLQRRWPSLRRGDLGRLRDVRCTVVSRPTPERAVLDAGSKVPPPTCSVPGYVPARVPGARPSPPRRAAGGVRSRGVPRAAEDPRGRGGGPEPLLRRQQHGRRGVRNPRRRGRGGVEGGRARQGALSRRPDTTMCQWEASCDCALRGAHRGRAK